MVRVRNRLVLWVLLHATLAGIPSVQGGSIALSMSAETSASYLIYVERIGPLNSGLFKGGKSHEGISH